MLKKLVQTRPALRNPLNFNLFMLCIFLYRKVLPTRPGLDPKRLGIKTGLNCFDFFQNLV